MFLQSLKAEFDQHETLLHELEKQAVEYKAQGRTEAATRLEQQIAILKVCALPEKYLLRVVRIINRFPVEVILQYTAIGFHRIKKSISCHCFGECNCGS